MSDCQSVRDLLALRPDDRRADERRRVEIHLRTCPECAALARSYARQDRLIGERPRARLSASQRDQFWSALHKERRRYEMHARLSTLVGAALAAVALVALTLGLYTLFREGDQLAVDAPASTDALPLTPVAPIFADEVHLAALTIDPQAGEPLTVTLEQWDASDLPDLGRLYTPGDVHLDLEWQVFTTPTADWRVFVHLMDEAGQLVLQSDVGVDWPSVPCAAGERDPACRVTSEHTWAFPSDFPPGLYTLVAGLYDPQSGRRAPVTNPARGTPDQVTLGQLQIIEPLIFAEIRYEGQSIDPLTGKLVPLTLGERDPFDPFGPGRLQVPVDAALALPWRVVAPPSVDWQVFVHLVSETGQVALQSDVSVDWPEQPCAGGEPVTSCVVYSDHRLNFSADFLPGLYTIVVGLYDPETGERAPLTSPAGATSPQAVLGQVQVVSGESGDNLSPTPTFLVPTPTHTPTPPPPPPPPPTVQSTSTPPSSATHVIREGETLSAIAARYGVSLEALVTANADRDVFVLQPGKVLLIPGGE